MACQKRMNRRRSLYTNAELRQMKLLPPRPEPPCGIKLEEEELPHPLLPLRIVSSLLGSVAATVVDCYCGYSGNPGSHRHYERREADALPKLRQTDGRHLPILRRAGL